MNQADLAFKLILETYDGISSSDIDYGNVSDARADWIVGRQLLEKKNSAEYLKELAKHTFVGIYPTRKGLRGLSAWYDLQTSEYTFGESAILDILSWKKSPISKVYNDFTINYDYNPGSKKYNKSIFITKTDESAFPNETDAESGSNTILGDFTTLQVW